MSTEILQSYSPNNRLGEMSFEGAAPKIDSRNVQIVNCFRRLAVASALVSGTAFLYSGICTVIPGTQLSAAPLLIAGGVWAAVAIVFALISCGLEFIENRSRLNNKAVTEDMAIKKDPVSETENNDTLTEKIVSDDSGEEDLSEISYRRLTSEENKQVARHYEQIIKSSENYKDNFGCLPKETVQLIITFAKRELHKTALVCKAWKILSYIVHREVFPFDTIFGVQVYDTLGVKPAGKISPMPLCAYRDHEEDKEISFLAKAIIRKNENGIEGEEEVLSSNLFVELIAGPTNKGYKIELAPDSWRKPIDAEKPPSKSYWLCRGTKTIIKGKKFAIQTQEVEKEGPGTYIPSLREIMISAGGNYALSGKKSPIFDKTGNDNTWIRVSDLVDGFLPCIDFYPAAVDGLSPARLYVGALLYDDVDDLIGVVSARKSIDT